MDLLLPEKYMWHLLYCYGNWKKCLTIGVLILNSHCKVFILKDLVPDRLFSHVVYKFVCAGCNACYNGNALLLVPKTSALDIQHWALKLFLLLHSYLLWEQKENWKMLVISSASTTFVQSNFKDTEIPYDKTSVYKPLSSISIYLGVFYLGHEPLQW